MVKIHRRSIVLGLALGVPFMTLAAPSLLTISGVGPSWAVLWLLPWALENDPIAAAFAGGCLALILDGLSLEGSTQLPALILLGFWWGHLGRRGLPIDRSLILGLLAWVGTILLGLSLWAQNFFLDQVDQSSFLNLWGIKTLLTQSLITGLLAPILCSWLLLLSRRGRISS